MKATTRKGKNKQKVKDTPKRFIGSSSSIAVGVSVAAVACLLGVWLFYFTDEENDFTVSTRYTVRKRFNVSCSQDYKTHTVFEGCTPTEVCGRVVRDGVVTKEEAERLLDIAQRGFAHGGSSGGASILDLHSGALSKGEKFVDIYKYLKPQTLAKTFKNSDFEIYSKIKSKVHKMISSEFGIDGSKLFLTHPTFFSRITSTAAKTMHDEYWHKHIDKIQYGSFDYTSLLYLTDYKTDFTGGRFIFDDENNVVVEPKKGRLSLFTSGSENPHHVEKVDSGVRYAITISFTCDPEKSIKDPRLPG